MVGRPVAPSGPRRGRRVLLGTLLACLVVLSLLWWRTDADVCICEHCPDEYCTYATQIHALLDGSSPDPIAHFLDEGAAYLHAHSPLAPALVALLLFGGLQTVPAFALLSVAATILCWRILRGTIERAWAPREPVLLMLTVAFFANPIVIRSLARPVTDAIGMLCAVWSLAALDRHLATRGRRGALRLVAAQSAGLASRVSFIPMLGLPMLAELAEPGPWRERLGRAARSGIVFGALPALLVFGTLRLLGLEHVVDAWAWAHQPDFVSKAPLRHFAASATLAGAAYLALGLLGFREGRLTRAWRLHLAWVVIYLTFLAAGRAALWPRYFLPVVPSLLVVATPALLALDRRSARLAWGIVALCALLGGHAVLRTRHAREALALAGGSIAGTHEHGRALSAAERAGVSVTSSVEPASAALMLDGRVDTAWSTIAPQAAGTSITLDLGRPQQVRELLLATDGAVTRGELIVDGALDGEAWARLPVRIERTGFFARRPQLALRLPRRRVRRLRITATAPREIAWEIGELDVRVARD